MGKRGGGEGTGRRGGGDWDGEGRGGEGRGREVSEEKFMGCPVKNQTTGINYSILIDKFDYENIS